MYLRRYRNRNHQKAYPFFRKNTPSYSTPAHKYHLISARFKNVFYLFQLLSNFFEPTFSGTYSVMNYLSLSSKTKLAICG